MTTTSTPEMGMVTTTIAVSNLVDEIYSTFAVCLIYSGLTQLAQVFSAVAVKSQESRVKIKVFWTLDF